MSDLRPDKPIAGWYKQKLVRGGPWCPVRIWADESAELNGQSIDIWKVWPGAALNPIDEKEYRYLLAMRGYAIQHDPSLPAAAPTSKIDLLTVKPPSFRRKKHGASK